MNVDSIIKLNILLTLLTVSVCICVMKVWIPKIRSINFLDMEPRELLIIGIFISFFCACCDNIYWGITWLSKLQNWPTSQWWFDHGPTSNIFFRHIGKISAGYCHIEAARMVGIITKEKLIQSMLIIIVICLTIFLMIIRGV